MEKYKEWLDRCGGWEEYSYNTKTTSTPATLY